MDFLKDYEKHLLYERQVSVASANKYLRAVKSLAAYLNGNHRTGNGDVLLTAKAADIERYFFYLAQTKMLTRSSRSSWIKSGIRHFYNFAHKRGLTQLNFNNVEIICRKTEKEKRERQYLNHNHIAKIIEYLQNEQPPTDIKELYEQSERHCLIHILIETGARISEILNIRLEHINFENAYVLLNGQKNAERYRSNGWRRFPLNNNLLQIIKTNIDFFQYIYKKPPEKLFHVSVQTLRNYLHKIASQAEFGLNLHPHLFRHYQITRLRAMFDNNGNRKFTDKEISKLFGVSIKVLEEVYDHTDEALTREKYLKQNVTMEKQ